MTLENGQSIGIEVDGDPWTMTNATVLSAITPRDLPDLGNDTPDPQLVCAMLEEAGVLRLAWISYQSLTGEMLVFLALQSSDGNWHDLKGKKLHIWTISSCASA